VDIGRNTQKLRKKEEEKKRTYGKRGTHKN
jgi:hypothetical protein